MELADLPHQCRSTLLHSFHPDAPRLTTTVYNDSKNTRALIGHGWGYQPKTHMYTESLVMHRVLNLPTLGLPAMHES